jgi:phosphate/phosphite/phosphonate ABC transporter binding protein
MLRLRRIEECPVAELISLGIPSPFPTLTEGSSALGSLLGRLLDRPVRVVPAVSYTELADNLAEGRTDFAWLPPLEAVQAADYAGADLLLQAFRGRKGNYESLVFVAASSAAKRPEELAGKRIAYVHRRSASGYIVAAADLAGRGVEPTSPPLFFGSHRAVVQAVAEGAADAGATFGNAGQGALGAAVEDAGWQEFPPEPPCEMRVLASAGPVPPDAICAWAGSSRAARRDLVRALLAAGEDSGHAAVLKGVFGTSRFVRPDLGRYEILNASLAALRAELAAGY